MSFWTGPVQGTSPRLRSRSRRWCSLVRGSTAEARWRLNKGHAASKSIQGAGKGPEQSAPCSCSFVRLLCGPVRPSHFSFEMSSTSSPAAFTLSSPPSSPNTYRFSSSPAPPSPEPTTSLLPPIELDEPPLDPFSGTSKSIRPPPLYEKATRVRARSPGDGSPLGPRKRARHAFNDPLDGRVSASTSVQISPIAPIATKRYSEEESVWNEVISRVIDTVDPVVDLSCVP